jgi:hypothetical protein
VGPPPARLWTMLGWLPQPMPCCKNPMKHFTLAEVRCGPQWCRLSGPRRCEMP